MSDFFSSEEKLEAWKDLLEYYTSGINMNMEYVLLCETLALMFNEGKIELSLKNALIAEIKIDCKKIDRVFLFSITNGYEPRVVYIKNKIKNYEQQGES